MGLVGNSLLHSTLQIAMKIIILMLLSLSIVGAVEAEFLHLNKRAKQVTQKASVIITGSQNGLWIQFTGNAVDKNKFDKESSFVLTPSGAKTPLNFSAVGDQQPNLFWNCKFKDKVTHSDMKEGIFEYNIHLTIDGKPHSFIHKLKYTVTKKWSWGTKGIQKELANHSP